MNAILNATLPEATLLETTLLETTFDDHSFHDHYGYLINSITVEEVKARISWMDNECRGIYENHGSEDNMYRSVLATIARGECPDPAALAREALRSSRCDFPRYME